jgi:serine/threonine protein kinase
MRLVRSKTDQGLYVMKSLDKASLRAKGRLGDAIAQRDFLLRTVHPFLVRAPYAFESGTIIFIAFDYVRAGGLFTHLLTGPKISERRAQMYSAELLLALGHLHENGILYRDLRRESILVDCDGHIRLTAFGISKTDTAVPEFVAPEVRTGSPCTKAADWWSYGIVLYELMYAVSQLSDNRADRMSRMIISDPVQFLERVSAHARDLIRKLLETEPERRIGSGEGDWNEIKVHPFFHGIDWDDLLRKEIEADWRPPSSDELGTDGFEGERRILPVRDDLDVFHVADFTYQ